jgi:translocation and assembly module TamA
MLKFRSFQRVLPCLGFAIAGFCILTANPSFGWFFSGITTDYTLENADSDPETAAYVQKILDERVREKTKTLVDEDDDADLRARQESYLEQTVLSDLIKALQARGYYDAEVHYEDAPEVLSGTYVIDYGQRYTISSLVVSPEDYAPLLAADAPMQDDFLIAESVLKAQADLQNDIGKDHCYFDLSVENRVKLTPKSHTGAVEFVAEAEREGHFGPVSFEGNDSVRERYLRRLLPWRAEDCFRRSKLETYKTSLLESGLFSKADIILPEDGPEDDGAVPVIVRLKERAQRTVGAGLTYYSDEGIGTVLSWEHRNFLGHAEKLTAELNLSTLKQSLDFGFQKPFFLRKDQSLSLSSALRRQDTDAFEEMAFDTGGSVTRKIGKHLSISTGLEASILRINDSTQDTTETYGLFSAPQSLSYDTRDDTLDPSKGVNLSLNAEPFFDLLGEADPFFKTQITGSSYLSLHQDSATVLAAKTSIGTILGADIDSIPATERFYAGGGGSVRGYGYQEVGPQINGDPSGGQSLATFSLEVRTKFTDTIGGVAFIDAGSVSETTAPDFSNMAVGAGIGVRYYTSFGPIRFDIATPLTQKEDLDQNYQFYISIGQAF